jgi:hypothetical protein
VPTVTTLSADVGPLANDSNWHDALTVTFAAGTWLILAQVQCDGEGTTNWEAKLWDGGSSVLAANMQPAAHPCITLIGTTPHLTGPTAYKVSVNHNGNITAGYVRSTVPVTSAGINPTRVLAFQIS